MKTRYTITVTKNEEPEEGKVMAGRPMMPGLNDGYEKELFRAKMSADATVEILNHLHNLNDAERRGRQEDVV